jgi:hypothetical protein
MAQKVHDKITELYELVDNKEDVLLCLYRAEGGCVQKVLKGRGVNVVAFIAAVMKDDPALAKVIETAYDAYTAFEMNEKLKNKEL